MAALKHVRPGNGFEFKGEMFDKVKTGISEKWPTTTSIIMSIEVEANGDNEHPIFKFLKKSLPQPSDDPESLMANPQFFIWRPVKRSDIAWNFEKFLIGPDGTPLKRYSRYVQILRGQEGVYLYLFQKLSDLRYSSRYQQSYLKKKWWNSWDGRWIVYWRKKWCKVWKYFTNYVESESFCILLSSIVHKLKNR